MLKGLMTTAGLFIATSMVLAQPPAKPAEPAKPATPATPAKPATPAAPAKAAEPAKKIEAPAMDKNILATAATTGSHTTFLAAIKAAGLEEALNGKGPFTVFAPSDEAFKKLPAGTLDNLLKPENKAKLANLLKGHVLNGSVMAADVTKLNGKETEKTLDGHPLKVEVKDGKVMVGTDAKAMATVTKADVKASNGVIHVIDTVILTKDEAKAEHKAEPKKEEPKKDAPKSK